MFKPETPDTLCIHCNLPTRIANPAKARGTGNCNHVYYPDNPCSECQKMRGNKELEEVARKMEQEEKKTCPCGARTDHGHSLCRPCYYDVALRLLNENGDLIKPEPTDDEILEALKHSHRSGPLSDVAIKRFCGVDLDKSGNGIGCEGHQEPDGTFHVDKFTHLAKIAKPTVGDLGCVYQNNEAGITATLDALSASGILKPDESMGIELLVAGANGHRHGLGVDTSHAGWQWTFRLAFAWLLMPLMAVASKIFGRKIRI